jgi:hypothetical protein
MSLVWQSAFSESLDITAFFKRTDSHASVATLARNDTFWGLSTHWANDLLGHSLPNLSFGSEINRILD